MVGIKQTTAFQLTNDNKTCIYTYMLILSLRNTFISISNYLCIYLYVISEKS